ncbi:CAZyme family GH18 [Aspergillus niger]|nr:CAZyme family GH18 [Aspergillus niger]KAI3001966.1 CAZyme family GH18 [Aspergillus niger]
MFTFSVIVLLFTRLVPSISESQLPTPLLVTYWGQGSRLTQRPLRSYCDLGYNVVVLGFIDKFGNETLHVEMDTADCSTNNTGGCNAIASDITYCQSRNVKVLMSMGGATVHDCARHGCPGEYRFDSADEANNTAEQMYHMFFAGNKDSSYWRPFGAVQLDGVDLDIEETSTETPEGYQAYQWHYDEFIAKLRELQGQKGLIVSAAPECHHGCLSNCNPLEQAVNLTKFDYLFVQFYNDPGCSLLKPDFESSLNYWLNLRGPSSRAKIVLGVPGDIDETDPAYFVPPEKVVSIYAEKHKQNNRVDGIGIWQASSNTIDPNFSRIIREGLGT